MLRDSNQGTNEMQIARFISNDGNIHFGCMKNDRMASLIQGDILGDFEVTDKQVQVKMLLSPVQPTAILCIGLNYRMHAQETGLKPPEFPILFMKNPASVTGPEATIEIPLSCLDPLQVDYEAELAVVIGRKTKNISVENALDAVFGYTCANDISARTWQKTGGGKQWVRGKSFDTFCPMGPVLITSDEISNPQSLTLEARLNGQVMQQGSTSDMIFPVAELISFLSESTTLMPGTVILTGTPSGVGFTRTPPVFLKPGDLLETKIQGIGVMKNPVAAEPSL